MPHSSGGGSHGGGFHYSSHSSSRSSSHSSSGSSHSSSDTSYYSGPPVSRHHYSGASKYVYYDRRGGYHYLYSNRSADASLGWTIFMIILCSVIAIPLIWFNIYLGIDIPKKIDISTYSHNIIIEDHLDLVDESRLLPSLERFQDTTGVTVGIMVVADSEWINDYYDSYDNSPSLENYAYEKYLVNYNDEYHWLIVVSYPDDFAGSEFINWKWEGMIGDDVSRAFNSGKEDAFTEEFQRNLYKHDPLSESTDNDLTAAIANSFDTISSTCMQRKISYGWLIVAFIIFGAYAAICWSVVDDYLLALHLKFSYPVSGKLKKCQYCGTEYINRTVIDCPKCGAPLNWD